MIGEWCMGIEKRPQILTNNEKKEAKQKRPEEMRSNTKHIQHY